MPPPGYEPFLRAICADPDDDTARLVYADWLDENGDPDRAEFIRCQVAVLERPNEFDLRYARTEELRKEHGERWRGEFPVVRGITYRSFRRGFIDGITFQNFRAYMEYGPALLAEIPARDIGLLQVHAADITPLLADPNSRRLTVLKANVGIAGEEVLERLTATDWEWRLEELDVTAWGPNNVPPQRPLPMITDRAALLLARCAVLPRLYSLRLAGASLSAGAYGELVVRFGRRVETVPRMTS